MLRGVRDDEQRGPQRPRIPALRAPVVQLLHALSGKRPPNREFGFPAWWTESLRCSAPAHTVVIGTVAGSRFCVPASITWNSVGLAIWRTVSAFAY
jgi:hypothetical protein